MASQLSKGSFIQLRDLLRGKERRPEGLGGVRSRSLSLEMFGFMQQSRWWKRSYHHDGDNEAQ